MVSKTEFKAKLDGSFESKLRAAYMAGFQDGFDDDGFDDGIYDGGRIPALRVWIEERFQSWLKDPQAHTGIEINEKTA